MSESNLPNSDEKTEQNLSPPEGPETQDLGNSPPEIRDTLPPAPHGWLPRDLAEALILLAAKLTVIALSHDEDALEKVVDQVNAFSKQTG